MKLMRRCVPWWLVPALLPLALVSPAAVAQTPRTLEHQAKAASPAWSAAVEIPFELRSGKIIIDTMVNGKVLAHG